MVSEMNLWELQEFLSGNTTRCEGFRRDCAGRVMPLHKFCKACESVKAKEKFEEEMKNPGDKWYVRYDSRLHCRSCRTSYDMMTFTMGRDYLACCTAESCEAAAAYWGSDLADAAIATEKCR